MKHLVLALLIALLSACASTPDLIVGNSPNSTSQPLPIPITNPTIVTDLQSALWNADQAVSVGALAKDDPLPSCLHEFLGKAGIDPTVGPTTAPPSFVPKNDGAASLGVTLYILNRQAQAALGQGITVSLNCKALIGQVTLDSIQAVNKALPLVIPGAGMLHGVLPKLQ